VSPELRRNVFCVFKEAVNNAARHSECRQVSLRLAVEGNVLEAEIRDDGLGLRNRRTGGHGLESMRKRGVALGGEIEVTEADGGGTVVRLRAPFHRT
jgi:signal transduction histidine kinase